MLIRTNRFFTNIKTIDRTPAGPAKDGRSIKVLQRDEYGRPVRPSRQLKYDLQSTYEDILKHSRAQKDMQRKIQSIVGDKKGWREDTENKIKSMNMGTFIL